MSVTKTWQCNSGEGFSFYGYIIPGYETGDGNPASCIGWFLGSGFGARAESPAGETWEDWGVAAGDIVTTVSITIDTKINIPWGANAPYLYVDIVFAGLVYTTALGPINFPTGSGWVTTVGGSVNIPSAYQASNTGVYLRVSVDPNDLSSYGLLIDNIVLHINTGGGTPLRLDVLRGVVVAAWTDAPAAGVKALNVGVNRSLLANVGSGSGATGGWLTYKLLDVDEKSDLGLVFLPNGRLVCAYDTYSGSTKTAKYQANDKFGGDAAGDWGGPWNLSPNEASMLTSGRAQQQAFRGRQASGTAYFGVCRDGDGGVWSEGAIDTGVDAGSGVAVVAQRGGYAALYTRSNEVYWRETPNGEDWSVNARVDLSRTGAVLSAAINRFGVIVCRIGTGLYVLRQPGNLDEVATSPPSSGSLAALGDVLLNVEIVAGAPTHWLSFDSGLHWV